MCPAAIEAVRQPALIGRSVKLWFIHAVMVMAGASFALAQDPEPVPKPLKILRIQPSGKNVTIIWEGGAGPYQLLTKSTADGQWVEADEPTTSTSLTAVNNSQMAFFRVSSGQRASNDRKAPSTPAALFTRVSNCGEIALWWSAASDTGSGVKGYMLYRDGVFLKTVLAPETATVDIGLTESTTYSYTIRAYDYAGNLSPMSGPASATTTVCPDTEVPTIPTGVAAAAVSSTQINLNWQPASDSGGAGLAGYLIYSGPSYVGESSSTSFAARNLTPNTDYCFTVVAYDWAGNSSPASVLACARTLPASGPANDNFANRASYAGVVTASTIGATKEAGEPSHAGNAGGRSVWFTWTAPSEAQIVVSTAGSSFDTLLGVYRGNSVGALEGIASNDNDPLLGTASLVRFASDPGAVYHIAVDGRDGQSGTVRLEVTVCAFAIYPTSASYGPNGGSASINIGAVGGCSWGGSSSANWITITSGGSGTGNGVLNYSVASNPFSTPRSATITVAGQTFSVTQQAGACSYSLSSPSGSFAAAGGNGSVNVIASAGDCPWSASSGVNWVTITSGGSGAGNGTVTFNVAANPNTSSRNANLTIAGRTYAITQGGAACSYSLSATSSSLFPASGGIDTVNVTAQAGCNWSASTSDIWITILSGASGSGSGTVTFFVDNNASTQSRSGRISIAGQNYTVNQAGGSCSYTLAPANASFNSFGGTGAVTVTTLSGCAWTAVPSASWITITSGGSGNSSGRVNYSVALNTTAAARSGSINIQGQSFPINQAVDATVPPTPTGLSALAASCSEVNVAWFGVTDQGGSGLRGYRVYRNGVFLREVTATSITDSGLAGSTTYSYTVEAVDAVGNRSPQTSAVNASTPACPDSTAPTITLTAPANGAVVSNVITVSASASDNVGVTRVDFYRDSGVSIGGATAAPFSVLFDTAAIPSGSHRFYARASDAAGNTRFSATNTVMVTNLATGGGSSWARSFGNGNAENGQSVAVDSAGNIAVGGYFSGTIDLGAGAINSGNTYGMFLGKFRNDGACIWSKRLTVTATPFALEDIAFDAAGGIVIVGYFAGVADFGGGPLVGAGKSDIFVAKFDANGTHLWSRKYGGPGVEDNDFAYTVSLDRSGNIIVGGTFMGAASLGGPTLGAPFTGTKAFVAKYQPDGAHIWSRVFDCNADHWVTDTAIDSADNILLSGYYSGAINFGAGYIWSQGASDVFVTKLAPSGSVVWGYSYGGLYTDWATAIAVDSRDNVIVTGIYYYRANFGGNNFSNPGSFDVFLAKYNSAGAHIWSRSGGSLSSDMANSLAVDRNDNIIVTGYYQTLANFGGSDLLNRGGYDIFLAKYSASGSHIWSESAGDGGTDVAYAVAVDASANIITTGNFQGPVTFGTQPLTSAGNFDVFLYRRGP